MPTTDITSTVQHLTFHEDILDTIPYKNTWAVSLRRICENLGVDYSGQLQKLKKPRWATVEIISTVGADGKLRNMTIVDRKTLTMWLATLSPSHIPNPLVRQKVELYQEEVAEAIDAYFHEGGAIRVLENDTDTDIMARALVIANKTLERREQRIREMETKVAELEPKAEALDVFTAVEGSYSVADAAKLLSNDLNITIGRNRLYGFMAEINWVFRDSATRTWKAYQSQVDNGRLEMKAHTEHGTHHDGTTFPFPPTVRITAKGLDELRRRLLSNGTTMAA